MSEKNETKGAQNTGTQRAEIGLYLERLINTAFAAGRACAVFEARPNEYTAKRHTDACLQLEELENAATDFIPVAPHDGTGFAPDPRPAVAEPMGWIANHKSDNFPMVVWGRLTDTLKWVPKDDHHLIMPVYDHPAPATTDHAHAVKLMQTLHETGAETGKMLETIDGVDYQVVVSRVKATDERSEKLAVAPQGVRCALISAFVHNDFPGITDQLTQITELPPPSDWAKSRMANHDSTPLVKYDKEDILDLAAALIERAKEAE